jgi:hypothetical protein
VFIEVSFQAVLESSIPAVSHERASLRPDETALTFVDYELDWAGVALLARAHKDEASYGDYRDRYRALAAELGSEGHIAWAEAMP